MRHSFAFSLATLGVFLLRDPLIFRVRHRNFSEAKLLTAA